MVGFLQSLFGGGDGNTGGVANLGLSMSDFTPSASVLDATQALGMALLQGDRDQPFKNLPQAMLAVSQQSKAGNSKAGLKALLLNAGFPEDQAEQLSTTPETAKLALAQKNQERALGGGADEPPLPGMPSRAAPSNMPSMSPAAPPGPAAGASLNGGGGLNEGQTASAKAIYDGVIQRGGSPMLASAIVGNFAGESSFNPTIGGDHRNGVPTSFGLGQWRMERLDALKALGQQQGKDWRDVGVQLDHTMAELNGGDAGAARAKSLIDKAQNPEAAAAIFARYFERPSASALAKSLPGRQSVAADTFRRFGQGGATQVADASGAVGGAPGQADIPAAGGQEAGFVIPPAAAQAATRAVGSPPAPIDPRYNPEGTTAKQLALKNFDYWARRLRFSGTLGEAGKGLAEEAKQRMELAKSYITDTEAEKAVRAAGLQGEDAQSALAGAIPGNAPTSLQKEYRTYAQQEMAGGRTPLSFLDYDLKIRGASKPEQNTVVKNFTNPIAKGLGDQLLEQRKEAAAAAQSIPQIHQARQLLDEGVFTGPLAEQKLALGRVGTLVGLQNPKVESTEAFASAIGNQVLANIKALGANPSNTDREFIEKVAGGKITLTDPSLRRILDINENAARQKISIYNGQVEPMVATADDELKPFAGVLRVKEPGGYQRAERAAPPIGGVGSAPSGSQPAPTAAPPAAAIDALRKNPQRWDEFEAKFGRGSSARYLGGVL